MSRGNQDPGSRRGVRYLGLMSGIFVLVVLAAAFTVAVVQTQAGVAAYLAGQSIWSRGQVKTVLYLDAYAETGDPAMLRRARRWHDIPLGDLQARKAMETEPFDDEAAHEGFLRGRIHPADIPRLITLFRYFSKAPYFRDAVRAWQRSDQQILALGDIADQLETEWQAREISFQRRNALRTELDRVSRELDDHALEFRRAMTRLARLMPTALSLASVVFFIVFGVLAMTLTSRLTRALRNSERKFRATFEQAGMGIAQIAEDGRLLEVNQALCDILRYSREEILKLSYPELIHPENKESNDEESFAAISEAFENRTIEQRLLCGDGKTVWGRFTVSRFEKLSDSQACYIAILEDVSESRRLSAELSYQASHDELTGLNNRRAFERYLEEFLQRAHNDGSVHALCFIDLDQFKIINDTSGHFVGDYLLRQVAESFSHHIRKGDLLARLGGDEFALILEHCEPDTAINVAEKLRKTLMETTFAWGEQRFSIGCSIGVVPITATSVDMASLLRMADAACYLAKERGRNRVHLAYEDDRELVERREQMEWVSRVRSALEEDRLFMDAQYIVSLTNSVRLRYEVLVRMTDDDGTVLPPGAFLPAAERFDMVHLIDRWVIEHVFMQLHAHPAHLAQLEACHINVSGPSFDQEDFLDFVVALFEQYAIPCEKICFEITETAAVRNLNDARLFMERLGTMGCQFALDDFGAGLSSFGYLRQLPVDIIKIDGHFVRNVATDETDRAMVNAINNIGQSLGKMIVAEFVEDNMALELLRGMGVHLAQGYAVQYPGRFAELIKDRALNEQG
ncbi:putative bifunctional diguanylate cyclase/phosphodiesterase [Thiohalophilus thiocyanatoxydans]|uniref:Diguanylate cyclase/phosphodiesterase with PAS/PAC sensor(S) n=1 Tax=Thiohalophilus thiocyanatoxydans TaxID=381308 RepID=A0A4R8ILW6_9GAMM|nr:EAL domain-containing protein [Thiohalophilus thiocyanatoxydans]TDY01124.1 diguanylate cyclase/phosphodiesterase with PAS/PAC sensor(s) [Thiohalophilus thiocyanatoxydans]